MWNYIIVTVPRQSGKTTAAGSWGTHRAITTPKGKIWYTAQTGQKARDRWLEMAAAVQTSVFGPFVKVLKTNGSEALLFPEIRSQFRPHPPTEESLHSEQSDLNIVDEAWAYDEYQADALMQAIVPTQTTRPMRQTIIISTMGTADSTWFHREVEKARSGDPSIFMIDYGIGPDVDANDLDAVAAAHPAFGHIVDMDALVAARKQLGEAGFARAYGNCATGAKDTLIPMVAWNAAATSADMPAESPAWLGAAIDHDRTETAIAAATMDHGMSLIEIIEVRPGTSWAADRLAHLEALPQVEGVVIDQIGPSATLHAEASKRKLKLITPTGRDVSTAAAELMDRLTHVDQCGVAAPRIRIRRDPSLDAAVEVVDRRSIGDAWTWSRRGSAGSIAALEAATLALHGLLAAPKKARAPFIR